MSAFRGSADNAGTGRRRPPLTRYLAPVIGRVEPYLKMLRPGANIVLDEDLRIAAIQRDGQRENFDVLSGRTKEQLAVLTRLAFAELLLGQGRPATVIRPIALNRKNALFAGSDGGAEHWATVASLIETCKLNEIDPLAYLTDVLTRIVNGHSNRDIDQLLPWAYRKQELKAVA